MIKLIKCEYMKTKRKHIFLTTFALLVLMGMWAFYGTSSKDMSDFIRQNGYTMFLYQFPLVNAIFFPLLCTVIASRLCDIEHKGGNFKLLCTMEDKGKIFDVKLIYGLTIVISGVILFWILTIVYGKIVGFTEAFPINNYLLYLLFTIIPTASIYIFQHSLSMIFKNQAIPFFVGVIGEFIGLFSMFLPQFPFLRKSILWGYYGALQFVGLFGWDKQTRFDNAYFGVMTIDWPAFALLVCLLILIYIVGKYIFSKKEF